MPTRIVIELDATPEEIELGMRKLKNRDGGSIPARPKNGSITYEWPKGADMYPSTWALHAIDGTELFTFPMLSIRLG